MLHRQRKIHAQVKLAGERARFFLNAVWRLELTHSTRPLGHFTASLGLAFYPMHGHTPEILIEAADAALYEAKNTGRDRAVLSSVRGESAPPGIL